MTVSFNRPPPGFASSVVLSSVSGRRFEVSGADRPLVIEAGAYYDCVMPEDAEALWGPVPLRRLPEGEENNCKAVTHG